jgi:Domain of unknown function (DUF4286)
MYILNITYVLAESKVGQWKNWLKEEAFSQRVAFQKPDFRIYKIHHLAEEGQVSFSVQFDFETSAFLDLFEEELETIHAKSLNPLFGPQCLFFTTILSKEDL